MEDNLNQFLINIIIASFAYSYILYQLKVFLLKSGEPFESNANKESEMDSLHEYSRNNSISRIGFGLLFFIILLLPFYDFEWFKKEINIGECIGLVLYLIFMLIIFLEIVSSFLLRYNDRNNSIVRDVWYFIIFQIFCCFYYFSFRESELQGLLGFCFWAQLFGYLTNILANLILIFLKNKQYYFRITLVVLFLFITAFISVYPIYF